MALTFVRARVVSYACFTLSLQCKEYIPEKLAQELTLEWASPKTSISSPRRFYTGQLAKTTSSLSLALP